MDNNPKCRSIQLDNAASRHDNPRRNRNQQIRKGLTGALLAPTLVLPGAGLFVMRYEPARAQARVNSAGVTEPTSTTIFEAPETASQPDKSKSIELPKTPTSSPLKSIVGDIPTDYLALYRREGSRCVGLSWSLLAAVGDVESDHGRNKLSDKPNSAGAIGPMQFLPSTWEQYGQDGNGDEVRDVLNPADAIKGAANYLCESGLKNPSSIKNNGCTGVSAPLAVKEALWRYNRACWYVDKVLVRKAFYETSLKS